VIFESWEIVGTNWLGCSMLSGFNSVCGQFFGGGRWEKLLMGVKFCRSGCSGFKVCGDLGAATFFVMVHMWVKSIIANESCVGSGFGCTAKRHDMEMLIHLTERLFAPRRWIAFGDGERRDLVVVDRENRRRGFPCIQVMDTTRRIRMLGRCARDSELNGRIGWTADRMANRWAVALPGGAWFA
jgi:hypothetical protein